MSAESNAAAALIPAFLQARYEVWAAGRWWVIEPGTEPDGPPCIGDHPLWCIVTGHNPGGQRRPASRNRRAARALCRQLLERGPAVLLPACNRDPAGHWPDEPGWLTSLGSEPEIDALVQRFEQRAVLCGGRERRTRLWVYCEQTECETMQNATEKHSETVRILLL